MNLKFVLAGCQDQQAGSLCSPELQAESKQQVIELMKRCPAQDGDVIEIRQVAEMSDFPAEVQAAAKQDG